MRGLIEILTYLTKGGCKILEIIFDAIEDIVFTTLIPIVMFLVLEYTYRRDYEVPDIIGGKHFPSLPTDSISFSIAEFFGGGEVRWFTYYLFLFVSILLYLWHKNTQK